MISATYMYSYLTYYYDLANRCLFIVIAIRCITLLSILFQFQWVSIFSVVCSVVIGASQSIRKTCEWSLLLSEILSCVEYKWKYCFYVLYFQVYKEQLFEKSTTSSSSKDSSTTVTTTNVKHQSIATTTDTTTGKSLVTSELSHDMLKLRIHIHEILNNNFRLEFPKLNKWIVNLKGTNLLKNYMYIVQTVIRFLNQDQLQLFVGGLMSYLRYLCLFAYSGIQHILCCLLYSSSSVVLCCARVRLVCPMLPVSVDCLACRVDYIMVNCLIDVVHTYIIKKYWHK
jgi:hypothetical protein